MGGYGSGRQGMRPVVEAMIALRIHDLRAAICCVEGGDRDGLLHLVCRQGLQPTLTICCTSTMTSDDRCSLMIVSEPPDHRAHETIILTATRQPLGVRLVRRW